MSDIEQQDETEGPALHWGGEYPPAIILLAGEYYGPFRDVLQQGLQAQGFLDIAFSDEVVREESCHLVCEFDGHVIRVLGLNEDADGEAVQNALNAANCTREDKARMRAHRSHFFCQYLDGNPDVSAQLMALCQVALALEKTGAFALLDMEAWSCNPLLIVRQLLQLESAEQIIANPPVELWGGFVKFFVDENNIWFCSKAYHRWGVPDFAWFGQMPQAQEAYDLFRALFSYVREHGAQLKVGDTAQFGDNLLLRFGAIDPENEFLQGGGETLVIERLNPAAFH
ncbi:hypothetical protein V8J88_15805 [Massilia sp. W12]|uniref:hypothetical protein n=1 Tax=Massilia sp. W12 TaxID=3126507 RepID=UPI0030D45812